MPFKDLQATMKPDFGKLSSGSKHKHINAHGDVRHMVSMLLEERLMLRKLGRHKSIHESAPVSITPMIDGMAVGVATIVRGDALKKVLEERAEANWVFLSPMVQENLVQYLEAYTRWWKTKAQL
jgi:hypothetical protein